MYEQEPIMYYPFRHDANFKESSLNSSASTLLETGASGRPFTSFSGQTSTTPVFNHGGSLQNFNNVQGSYNLPSALSRNSGLGGTSNALHNPAGIPSGRYPSNNMPIGLSQLSQSSLHGHSSMTNRGALNVVGNHPLSSAMNGGGGVSGPGSVALNNRGNLAGLGGSLAQMGASGPRVQPSGGTMVPGAGAGTLNRTLSSGGSLPSLNSPRVNIGQINNAGGLGGGPTSGRAMSPMLQQGTYNPSNDVLSLIRAQAMLPPNFSSGQLPNANGQLGNLLNDGPNDGATFDLSDFPQLSNRHNAGLQGPVAAFRNKGVAVNSLGQQNQEFSIQNEDFPALPGFKGGNSVYSTVLQMHSSSQPAGSQMTLGSLRSGNPAIMGSSMNYELLHQYEHHQQQPSFRLGSAPQQQMPSLGQPSRGDLGLRMQDTDRFGLLGLLSVIRMTDQDLTTLALGTDLTTLGLNLNSRENLYKTFASPWADAPVKGEPEFTLPQCYVQTASRLQPAYFKKFPQETLFYIFYSMPNDEAQIYAAAELCNRQWSYHKEKQMWFQRASVDTSVKTAAFERGAFIFFDHNTWETVRKENFVLHYDHVENPPQLPQLQHQQQ